jgi:hypothetical protein
MAEEHRTEVEQLLRQVRDGDERARDALFDLVHAELRRMAGGLMGRSPCYQDDSSPCAPANQQPHHYQPDHGDGQISG